jgi:hypothetical protein
MDTGMTILRDSANRSRTGLGAQSATLADVSPISGIGTVSKVSGLNSPDPWNPVVSMSYTHSGGPGAESLILFDSAGLIEALLNPTSPVFPSTTNFGGAGSNNIVRAFYLSQVVEFNGFNYQISGTTAVQTAQLANSIKYITAQGPTLDQKNLDPQSFARNTAQNQFLFTFEADLLIKQNRAMIVQVEPGATVTFSFYTKVQYNSYIVNQ